MLVGNTVENVQVHLHVNNVGACTGIWVFKFYIFIEEKLQLMAWNSVGHNFIDKSIIFPSRL